MSGFVVWMTGLSGAGKSTLATRLTQELTKRGVHVECLDGDEVRKNLSHGLGFSRDDRDRNVRRIGYVARMVARSGACAITAAISPYRALRDEIRTKTENFMEVYCECPLDVLTERDPKGLYKRALAGELKNFTGVDDPYEAPENPEVWLRTDRATPEECVQQILHTLEQKGLLGARISDASALVPPFGGEVFQARPATPEELSRAQAGLEVSEALTQNVLAVGAGYFSPVSGFMTEREAVKVQKNHALESGTPWWGAPFVLPAGDISPNIGDHVALRRGGEAFALMRVDQIWRDASGLPHLAGPLEAALLGTSSDATARDVRALARKAALAPACVFAVRAPTEAGKAQLRLLCDLVPLTALAVRHQHADSWRALLSDRSVLLELPDDFPVDDQRAREVVQRSIGAHHSSLLE